MVDLDEDLVLASSRPTFGAGLESTLRFIDSNGLPFDEERPFLAALEGLAGKRVLLTVNGSPSMEGAREEVVVPLGDEGGPRRLIGERIRTEALAREADEPSEGAS